MAFSLFRSLTTRTNVAPNYRRPLVSRVLARLEQARSRWTDRNTRTLWCALIVAGAYFIGAQIGFSIRFQSSPISSIWPPNAILLAALLLVPRRMWGWCLFAVFWAHLLVSLAYDVPMPAALGLYVTNTAEAVLGAALVLRFAGGAPWLSSLRQVAIFLACAVIIAPVVTSFGDAAVVTVTGWGDDYWNLWATRSVSDSLAVLVIVPAILLGLTVAPRWLRQTARKRWPEATVLLVGLLFVGATVLSGSIAWHRSIALVVFTILPLLLWAAIRFGVGGTSAILAGLTALATGYATMGEGPFSSLRPVENLVSLQLFLIGVSAPMLFLAALTQERQNALDALHQSETRHRDLLESQTEMICRYLPDSTLTFVNEAFCRLHKKSREQLIGMRYVELLDNEARDHHLRYMADLLANPRTIVDEHHTLLPDGTVLWNQWIDYPINDISGHVAEFQSVGRDITERKRAELELRESKERYQAVVDNFPHGAVLLFGSDLRHIFAGGQALAEAGFAEGVIEGKTLMETFPDDIADRLKPWYQASLAGAQATIDIPYKEDIYQVQILPIQYAEAPCGMALMQNVTQERQAKALAELDRAKTMFLANISHEFRTPLTLLLGPAADALADHEEPLPPRQRERLEMIRRSGLRLSRLVNSLFDFSRIEGGRIQAQFEPTDIAALTADICGIFREAVEQAGVRLDVEFIPLASLAEPVQIDRYLWETIVLNLLSNALKFTFEGVITVSVRPSGHHEDFVELEVSDTGVGMPPDELPHLFERFYRVRGTRARTHEGAGIGLALVQELVQLHGGAVRVASALGKGSVFTVCIPTRHTPPQSDQVTPNEREHGAHARDSRIRSATVFLEEALRWLPVTSDPVQSSGETATEETLAELSHIQTADPVMPFAEVSPRLPSVGTTTAERTRQRILVADDNSDMRAYLVRVLGERWDILAVENGLEALDAVTKAPPDLILADVMMPGLDGLALASALRNDQRTSDVPIILLSARAGEEATVEGLEAGAIDYLVKPFSARELLTRIHIQLELAHARNAAATRAAQLGAIFESISDGVLVHDVEGQRLFANEAYRDLLDKHLALRGDPISVDSLLATPTLWERHIAITDDDGRRLAVADWATERALRGEILTGANAVDQFTQDATGNVLQVNVAAAPVRSASGQITGAVAVFRDVTRHRQLERQVARQASQLEAIFESMVDCVIVVDEHARIQRVNRAARLLFGELASDGEGSLTASQRAEQVELRDGEGQSLQPDQWPSARLLRGETALGGSAEIVTLRAADGQIHSLSVTGAPLREAEGERIIGAVTVCRDITELKNAQAALAEQESLFRTLVENSPDIITRFDPQLRHLYVSPASEKVTGIPARARLHKTYAELGLPESVYGPWEAPLRQAFATGQQQVFETTYQTHEQSARISQVRYIPEIGADGTVESVLGITTDITVLKQTEEALRRQEQLFRTLVENSPNIIARFDRSLRYLYVSPAIAAVSPIPPEQFIGKTNQELGWPEAYYAPAQRAIQEVFQTGRERTLLEDNADVRDGTEARAFVAQILPEFRVNGSVESVLTVTTEITELKRTEAALREALAAAEAAQKGEVWRRVEAERREEVAASLREVLAVLNSNQHTASILDHIAKQAEQLLGSDAAVIYMTEGNGPHDGFSHPGVSSSQHGVPHSLAPGASHSVHSHRHGKTSVAELGVDMSIIRKTIAARRPSAVFAPHGAKTGRASARLRSRRIEQMRDTGEGATTALRGSPLVREARLPAPYRALLAIPILSQRRACGCLLLLYTGRRTFSPDEVSLAMAYGDQIALAIANAQLHDHIEREAREKERNYLARELHDTVTQEIFTASLLAESIPMVWNEHRAEAEASMRQLRQITRGALAALRALLLELRPAVLEQKTLADLLPQLGEAMTTRSGAQIDVEVATDCPPIPPAICVTLYRIAQEALANAAKYAHARRIHVGLHCAGSGEAVQLVIRDDGQGFDMKTITAGHFGVGMMRERARTIGATTRISSRPGLGTRVAVTWVDKG